MEENVSSWDRVVAAEFLVQSPAVGRWILRPLPPEAGHFPAECRPILHLRAGCRPGSGRGGAGLDCGNTGELSRGLTQLRRRCKLSPWLRDVNLLTSVDFKDSFYFPTL